MTPYFSEQFDGVKYNHFHEWEEDNDELFEILPLPPNPDTLDSEINAPPPPSTRAAKFRNVIKLITRKKVAKRTGDKSKEIQGDCSTNKHATLPRMNKEERDARIRYLRDEAFGLGRFYQEPDPTKLYESEDPTPFVPSPAKTVRWKSDPFWSGNIENMEVDNKQDRQRIAAEADNGLILETRERREDNPYWVEEFELPEPELAYNLSAYGQNDSPSGCIPVNLRDILPLDFSDETPRPTSPLDFRRKITDNDEDSITDSSPNDSKPISNCGDPSYTLSSVNVLTARGVQANLGQEIADLIVTEMILRLGPPLPLPPRGVNESETKTLALREKRVVEMYAKWAATFAFQKLIVAIKLSLENFKPSHRGIVDFEFQVTP